MAKIRFTQRPNRGIQKQFEAEEIKDDETVGPKRQQAIGADLLQVRPGPRNYIPTGTSEIPDVYFEGEK